MAEIVGVAASGLALAEVAGKIVTASLTVKRLLDDIKELPESFAFQLDQVAILTPVLIEASCDATSRCTTPTPLDRALGAAAAQCRKALDQLQALASELSEQIEQSRGFRRRLAAVKIALRKDLILKHERRLSSAVQLLSIAQQTCILSVQRMQPGLLAVLIADELEARNQARCSPLTHQALLPNTGGQQTPLAKDTKSTTAKRAAGASEALIRLGLPGVTGMVEIQMPLRNQRTRPSGDMDLPEDESLLFGLKIQLPSWLSSRIVDSTVYQSHSGWTHHLRTYNIYPRRQHNPIYDDIVQSALKNDDLRLIQQQFQNRILAPFDRFTASEFDLEFNLLNHALICRAWKICNYLVSKGVVVAGNFYYCWYMTRRQALTNTDERLYQFTSLFQSDALDDFNRMNLLPSLGVSLETFLSLRRSVWSDDDFYSDRFRDQRHQMVLYLTSNGYARPSLIGDIVRSIMIGEAGVDDTTSPEHRNLGWPLDLANTVLRAVARGVTGHLMWIAVGDKELEVHGCAVLKSLRQLVTEVLLSADSTCADRHSRSLRGTLGKVLDSVTEPGDNLSRGLLLADKSLYLWLEMLAESGVDLDLYGKLERSLLYSDKDRHFDIIEPWQGCDNLGPRTRLIAFQYGSKPEDWKLCWAEATDVFVGEFWQRIENDTPAMPGSWVDYDEEYDEN